MTAHVSDQPTDHEEVTRSVRTVYAFGGRPLIETCDETHWHILDAWKRHTLDDMIALRSTLSMAIFDAVCAAQPAGKDG